MELITAIMPHFIIVSRACLITLTVSVGYTAPPSPAFSGASVDSCTRTYLKAELELR